MKGIILAGGLGTRLLPLTRVTNKHLIPVYDRPMIEYPINTLVKAGIRSILVICGREHSGHFMQYLGSGKERGLSFSYEIQDTNNGGIADALSYAEHFADGHPIAVILGDNIFEMDFSRPFAAFARRTTGAHIFLKKVMDPRRFGVARVHNGKIVDILEKPKRPQSPFAVTGLYLYGPEVFSKLKTLQPSARGELEITDIQNLYLQDGMLEYSMVKGFWSDAGTFDSLHHSSVWAKHKKNKQSSSKEHQP
jgi:glucose-1-phosphate thymidylyltransferase